MDKKKGKGSSIISVIITLACWLPLFSTDIFPLGVLMINECIGRAVSVFLLIFVFALVLSIVIHELGHLVFGLMSGYGFCSFRIFSILFVKTDEGIRIKKYSIPGTAGQCLMLPPKTNCGKMPTIFYNLGGSLLGLIASLVFAVLAILTRERTLLYMTLILLCTANLSVSLTNGIPMRTALINNDGKNALMMIKNPGAVESLRIQLLVNAEQSKGTPLADMPDEWFSMPSDSELSDSMMLSLACLCFARAFERGEYARAKEIADKIIASDDLAGLQRAGVILDLAFADIMLGKYDEAKLIFKKEYRKNAKLYLLNLDASRTRYAYELLVKGSEKGAKRELAIFRMIVRKLANHPFRDAIEREIALIDKIDAIYAERCNIVFKSE